MQGQTLLNTILATTADPATNSSAKEAIVSWPSIPPKRYFTIGEAAHLCCVKPHVLRYWEQEFLQLKPAKRRGNRRYYQSKDLLMVRQIRKLLYEDGFTIEGARAQLASIPNEVKQSVKSDTMIKKVIAELESVLQNLTL